MRNAGSHVNEIEIEIAIGGHNHNQSDVSQLDEIQYGCMTNQEHEQQPATDTPAASYLKPYQDAQATYGADFKTTLWASTKSQRLRFDIFRQYAFFTGKRVLDAGSGMGDFANFLLEHDLPYASYVGIDGLDQVVAGANERGLPHASFHCGDLVKEAELFKIGQPQITVISGTLNTMDLETVKTLLDAAWAGTSDTLLFNFMPDTADRNAVRQDYPARRHSTQEILTWAFAQTWNVQFRQDYFPFGHDATVMMRKPNIES